MNHQDLINRLRKRAEIRLQITTRKSVQENQPDRLAELLLEAATALEQLHTGWLSAVDQELVSLHLGVANADDSYEVARHKLNEIVTWNVATALDPKTNGGYRLTK